MTEDATSDLLRDAEHRHSRLSGIRDEAISRRADIARLVADAKARVGVKDEVKAVLDEMQAETYARVRGDYERILTALVGEVMPHRLDISLELGTRRGLPSLTVTSRRTDPATGRTKISDVARDHGRSLSNVVGTGLRLLAVVKSGGGRFVLLDEADCWLRPPHVPAFYSVVEDASRRLGLQCVVTSHFDIDTFGLDMRITRIAASPNGVVASCVQDMPSWPEDAEGFRYLRLIDFQSWKDATIHLSPGMNAVVGENDIGKSCVGRALQAVFYGDVRDSLIRDGSPACVVELGWSRGRVLRFERKDRGSPKNLWSFLERDGSVVQDDGIHHSRGGAEPPEWVERVFRIPRNEEIKVHLSDQGKPTFLLEEDPVRQAAILSIGREASFVPDMAALYKERLAADTATIRNGEREVSALDAEITGLAALDDVSRSIDLALSRGRSIEKARMEAEMDTRIASDHAEAIRRKAEVNERGDLLLRLPSRETTTDLSRRSGEAAHDGPIGVRLVASIALLDIEVARRKALERVPPNAPTLSSSPMDDRILVEIASAERSLLRASAASAALAALPDVPRTTDAAGDASSLSRLRRAIGDLDASRSVVAVLEALPGGRPVASSDPADRSTAEALAQAAKALSLAREIRERANELPSSIPSQTEPDDMLRELRSAAAVLRRSIEASEAASRAVEAARSEMDAILAEAGGICPLCGGHADVDHVAARAVAGGTR